MRILYVSPYAPSLRSGAGRHCYANLRALCELSGAEVDYVGPPVDPAAPPIPAFHAELSREYSRADKIVAAWRRSASSAVTLYREFARGHTKRYDLIFVETTRCGFVFDDGYVGAAPVFATVHNVEKDYMAQNARGFSRIAATMVTRSERAVVSRATRLLALHDHDVSRLRTLYGEIPVERCAVHPVCSMPPRRDPAPLSARPKRVAFVGSLGEHFNQVAIRTFVRTCWRDLTTSGWELMVAGSNPPSELVHELRASRNVVVVPDPPDIEPLLRNARMCVVPDIYGTGMKLRVAEALSLGVPVVGTAKGLHGYRDVDQFGRVADRIDDLLLPVRELMQEEPLLTRLSRGARVTWERHYSFDTFRNRLHGFISSVV